MQTRTKHQTATQTSQHKAPHSKTEPRRRGDKSINQPGSTQLAQQHMETSYGLIDPLNFRARQTQRKANPQGRQPDHRNSPTTQPKNQGLTQIQARVHQHKHNTSQEHRFKQPTKIKKQKHRKANASL